MAFDFSGRRVLVTGAGKGIGRGIAIRMSELGAEVFALSRTQADLDSLKAQHPAISTVCVDLANWDATRAAVKKILPIHHLVNNAGVSGLDPMVDAKPEIFDRFFNINCKSAMNVSQVVSKDLIERNQKGTIVFISSQASSRALDNHMLYCATKAALDSLTRSMALELGPKGIRTNSVNPTVVLTPMGEKFWSDETKRNKMLSRIPQGKFCSIDDVTNAVIFLLSDKSDMINGAHLPVEGGFLAC